jgi:hypothetical protein
LELSGISRERLWVYPPGNCSEEKCKYFHLVHARVRQHYNKLNSFITPSLALSRERANVYGWIGGDRPSDVLEQAKARKAQGFTAVKMNAVESVSVTTMTTS